MRPLVAQRQLVLAGLAILGVGASLGIIVRERPSAAPFPAPVGSYTALARSSGTRFLGQTTPCGVVLRRRTIGIVNPVLPCGMRLYVVFGGTHILATVIDNRLLGSTHAFEVTPALAQRLGLHGSKRVGWSYVAAADS